MTRLTSEIGRRQGRLKTVRPDRPGSSYTGTRSSTAWRWRFSRQATSPETACTQSASADDRAGITWFARTGLAMAAMAVLTSTLLMLPMSSLATVAARY